MQNLPDRAMIASRYILAIFYASLTFIDRMQPQTRLIAKGKAG